MLVRIEQKLGVAEICYSHALGNENNIFHPIVAFSTQQPRPHCWISFSNRITPEYRMSEGEMEELPE